MRELGLPGLEGSQASLDLHLVLGVLEIIELRLQLTKDGLDAGPVTIAWPLEQQGPRAPSTSTIRRILNRLGIPPAPVRRDHPGGDNPALLRRCESSVEQCVCMF